MLIAAIVLLISLFNPSLANAQTLAGTITALNGDATITRAARSFPATYAAPVDVGDQIATSRNGRLTVTLVDSSQLELGESSTFMLSQNLLNPNGTRAKTSVTLLAGLLRSLVRVAAGTPPNYEVHTPNAVASARGTTYDTYYTNNTSRSGFKSCKEFTDVSDYDGIVAVGSLVNPSSPIVELHSGQKTTVPCGLVVLPASGLAAIGGATATGVGPTVTAAAAAGGVLVIAGGVVGGIAATGGFDPSSPSPPVSPSM
jgi:hypothetical protein